MQNQDMPCSASVAYLIACQTDVVPALTRRTNETDDPCRTRTPVDTSLAVLGFGFLFGDRMNRPLQDPTMDPVIVPPLRREK